MDKNDVKVSVVIASVCIMLFLSIAGGMNLNTYLHERSAQKCMSLGRIYTEGVCVDNVQDLRYIK